MEDLQHKARHIRQLLAEQPAYAADLLIDLAREFSANEAVEDEAVLLKLELTAELEESELLPLREAVDQLVAQIVEEYNAAALAEKTEQKRALTEKLVHIPEHPVILEATGLSRKFPSTGFHLQVDHLELQAGQITGLLGENSTGKTTLFNVLAGKLLKTKGKIRFPLFAGGEKLYWFQLKDNIAYVPQELPAWKDPLLDTLHYEASLHGIHGEANDRAVQYVIQRLGLNEHVEKSWNQLSGGYKLRFSLAKALITGAQLLLLDEPLANLDIKTQQIVLNDLYYLTRSQTRPLSVLVSSQHIHEIEAVADRLYYLDNGKLEDLGPTGSYRVDRQHNVFELSSPVPTRELIRALVDFPHLKHWSSGVQFFITTPREVQGEELVAHLAKQGIRVQYFRDISQSVKSRFYAAQLS